MRKVVDLIEELNDISEDCIGHVSIANYQSRTNEANNKLKDTVDKLWTEAKKIDEINKDLLEALQAVENDMYAQTLFLGTRQKIMKALKKAKV